jgi:hypothetical protein
VLLAAVATFLGAVVIWKSFDAGGYGSLSPAWRVLPVATFTVVCLGLASEGSPTAAVLLAIAVAACVAVFRVVYRIGG